MPLAERSPTSHMRIGIVCEGPTDALAIENFVRASMCDRDFPVEFVRLQPEFDHTQGGWTNMVLWLENNPPQSRVYTYLKGLFGGENSAKKCDVILLHLDADLLSKEDFGSVMSSKYHLELHDSSDPQSRGSQIVMAITEVGRFSELADSDLQRHVIAPAVESTETWCVGVFQHLPGVDIETLVGEKLRDAFMDVLNRSEGRQTAGPYRRLSKSVRRRKRFCKKHAIGFKTLESQSVHYRKLTEDIFNLKPA